jgi:NAD(P)-dependent dehydrogenase (short-subunit alcohol dehydrogenase family)
VKGVVLVTGASSGIGRDAALFLDERGYTVAAGVRKPEDGERLRGDAPRPDALVPVRLDVTSADDVARAVGEVADLGPLRAVFSNAGIAAYDGDVSCEGCPLETQQRVMDVNFFGAVRVVQAFLPALRETRGTIVFNSALMAHTVIPFNAGYAASKCALEGWADSLRREVAPHGVRVALVEAAAISSSLEGKQDPSQVPADGPYPMQRALISTFLAAQARTAGRASTDPRRFSEAVLAAIESGKPRPRRIVGGGAKPIYALGLLPDRVQDAAFGLMLRRMARRAP